jgi:hypothetical protein
MFAKGALSLSFLQSHLVGDWRRLAMQLSEFKESASFEEVWQDQQIDLLEPREYLGEVFAGGSRLQSSAEQDSQIAGLRANFEQVTPQKLAELTRYLDAQLVKLNLEIGTNYLPAIRFMVSQTVDFFLLIASFYQRHKAVHGRMWRNNPDSFFYLSVTKCLNERGYEQLDGFLACSELYNERVKDLVKQLRTDAFAAFQAYALKTAQRFAEEQRQLEGFRAALADLREDLQQAGQLGHGRKTNAIDKIEETYGRVVVSTLFIVNETSTTLRSSFNVIELALNSIITALQEVKLLSDDFGCSFYDADKDELLEDPRPLAERVLEFLALPEDVQQAVPEETVLRPPFERLPDFKASEAKLRALSGIYETLASWFVCVCPFLDCFSDESRPERSTVPSSLRQALERLPEQLCEQLNPIFLVPNASSRSFVFEVRISRGHFPQTGLLVLAQDYLLVNCKSFTSELRLVLPFSLVAVVNEVKSFFGAKNGLEIFMKGSADPLTLFLADHDHREILQAAIGFGVKRASRIYETFVDRVEPGDLLLKVDELWQMHVRRARCWIMFASLVPILPTEKRFTETVDGCKLSDALEVCLGCGSDFNEAWCLDDWRKKSGAQQIEHTSPFFVPECYLNVPGTSPVQALLEAPLHLTFVAKYHRLLEDGSRLEVVEGTTVFNHSRDEVLLLFEHCSKLKTERSCFILSQTDGKVSIELASHEEDQQLYGHSWVTRVKDKCIRNIRSKLRREKRRVATDESLAQTDQSTLSANPDAQVDPNAPDFSPQAFAPDQTCLEKAPGSSHSSEKDLSSFEKVEPDAEEATHTENN